MDKFSDAWFVVNDNKDELCDVILKYIAEKYKVIINREDVDNGRIFGIAGGKFRIYGNPNGFWSDFPNAKWLTPKTCISIINKNKLPNSWYFVYQEDEDGISKKILKYLNTKYSQNFEGFRKFSYGVVIDTYGKDYAWYTTTSDLFKEFYPHAVEMDIEEINAFIDNEFNSPGEWQEPIHDNENPKIIGYVFNTKYEKFREHALHILGLDEFGGFIAHGVEIHLAHASISMYKMEEAGVLNVWFLPVYEPKSCMISINGRSVRVFKDHIMADKIKIKCAELDKLHGVLCGNKEFGVCVQGGDESYRVSFPHGSMIRDELAVNASDLIKIRMLQSQM